MRIAMIGTRGIPARYGGFETCVHEISTRLVERGHEVLVYCRTSNDPDRTKEYKGVQLIYAPSLKLKATDTFSHTFFSMIDVLRRKVDVIYVLNAANSPLCLFPRIFGKRIAINVDGLEWRRKKWGFIGRSYYQLAEKVATWFCQQIISDSQEIKRYYLDRYKTDSTFIAYGADIVEGSNPDIPRKYGLEPGKYFFVGSRLEPENNADTTVAAFERLKADGYTLAIAGGANYKSDYIKQLEGTQDPRIKFLGPVYEDGHMQELHCFAYSYVHGNEVGGTNPALLKAMGYGNCVLALNVPFNAEVVQDSALLYDKDPEHLSSMMKQVLDDPKFAQRLRDKAQLRIKEAYTWEHITDEYERFFKAFANRE